MGMLNSNLTSSGISYLNSPFKAKLQKAADPPHSKGNSATDEDHRPRHPRVPRRPGGVETHCENLYPCLARLGCDVTVITRRPYVDPGVTSHRGVRLVPLGCPRNKFLEAIVHTFRGVLLVSGRSHGLAGKMGCDILHIHAVGPSLFVPLARFLGLKVVITHHGPDYLRKVEPVGQIRFKDGERLGCQWANGIICISKTIAGSVKAKFGKEAAVIPNGVVVPQRAGDG